MSNLKKFTPYTPEMADKERKALKRGNGFKFPEGKNQIRVFPGTDGRGPFMITKRHWVSVDADQRRPITCMGPGCLLCMKSAELSRAGDEQGAKEFSARETYACILVDRNNEDAGPQLAELSWSIYDRLNSFVEQYGDFTDPESGYDITVKRVGTGKTDTRYTVDPVMKPKRKLAKDDAQLDAWLESSPALEDSVPLGTPDIIRKLVGDVGFRGVEPRVLSGRKRADDVIGEVEGEEKF